MSVIYKYLNIFDLFNELGNSECLKIIWRLFMIQRSIIAPSSPFPFAITHLFIVSLSLDEDRTRI